MRKPLKLAFKAEYAALKAKQRWTSRPRGRAPKNMKWDYHFGRWVRVDSPGLGATECDPCKMIVGITVVE